MGLMELGRPCQYQCLISYELLTEHFAVIYYGIPSYFRLYRQRENLQEITES